EGHEHAHRNRGCAGIGLRIDRPRRRAEPGALPRRRGLRGARRHAALLRALWRERGDRVPASDVVAGPLPPLEDADPVLRASLPLRPRFASRFARPAPAYRWWGRMTAIHWMQDYPVFAEWFISRCLPEPHSTKSIEDGVGWALDTDPQTLIATAAGLWLRGRRALRGLAQNLDCPVLVVHGDRDRITPLRDGRA